MSPDPRRALIVNRRGLHARAAAKFVKALDGLDAEVLVRRGGEAGGVSGRSIMGLMMLGAGLGTEIELAADGPDAATALDRLIRLITAKFDEDE